MGFRTYMPGGHRLLIPGGPYDVFATLAADQQFSRSDADFPESGITGVTDFTIQAWVKFDDLDGYQTIARKWAASNAMYWFAKNNNDGELVLFVSDDGTAFTTQVTAGVGMIANTWYHVAVAYDTSAGTADFYKNGAFVEQEVGGKTSIADKAPVFSIGALSLDGSIYNCALFNDMRTAGEIAASYADPDEDLSAAGNIIGQWLFSDAAAATQIDNSQGDAGRDLNLGGGVTTDYSTHSRTVGTGPA